MPLWAYLTAGCAALALLCGVQTYRIERLHGDLKEARAETAAAKALTVASEAARGREALHATAAYEGLQQTCTAGITAAIGKGRTIERILQAPAVVNGARRIVGADELRATLGQDVAPAARTP